MIDNEFMYMFAERLALFSREFSGRLHVSKVLRCYLPANAPYWLGHVVVRESYSFVESYIIHLLLIGLAELVLRRKSCYVLVFFSDVPYT
jgi:hypothetical protein